MISCEEWTALSEDEQINVMREWNAYRVVGNGPVDLIMVPGFVSHIECCWEEPSFACVLEGLAGFSRLIPLDKRGTGLSAVEGPV